MQGKAGRGSEGNDDDEASQDRDVNWIQPNEPVPQEDLDRAAIRRCQACEVDVRNDESGKDEKEINPQVAASEERQERKETGRYILLGVQSEHQQGRQRPDAGQGRQVPRFFGCVFSLHVW